MHEVDTTAEVGGGAEDVTRFAVRQLTRVEGEGRLDLAVRNGVVTQARLEIFEAPRYFERLVVGRTPDEVIDIWLFDGKESYETNTKKFFKEEPLRLTHSMRLLPVSNLCSRPTDVHSTLASNCYKAQTTTSKSLTCTLKMV